MAERLPQVALDDAILLRMMQDPTFTTNFPFLGTTMARSQPKPGPCGGCTRKNRARAIDFGLLRRQMAELPAQSKLRLKQLLNANQVLIRYQRPNGQSVKLTF